MNKFARLNFFGILALIGLRVCIGWHFYMEGVAKVQKPGFSSQGFLANAQGPLAPKFRAMIWDHDGAIRLDKGKMREEFKLAADQANAHFAFTDGQRKELIKTRELYISKLNKVYGSNQEEIYKYQQSTARVDSMASSPMWNDVESLRGQKEKVRLDRLSEVSDALASIDAIWAQYEGDLNALANETQISSQGAFSMSRPGEGVLSASIVDKIIPIFDMTVGILLIIGLLTPLAAWAAAIFLIGVVLSQMPGYAGTQQTYFQAAEAMALIVLATTDAGRYGGLDFIPWAWWRSRKASPAAA